MKILLDLSPNVEGALNYLVETWGLKARNPAISVSITETARRIAAEGHDLGNLHYHIDTALEDAKASAENDR